MNESRLREGLVCGARAVRGHEKVNVLGMAPRGMLRIEGDQGSALDGQGWNPDALEHGDGIDEIMQQQGVSNQVVLSDVSDPGPQGWGNPIVGQFPEQGKDGELADNGLDVCRVSVGEGIGFGAKGVAQPASQDGPPQICGQGRRSGWKRGVWHVDPSM